MTDIYYYYFINKKIGESEKINRRVREDKWLAQSHTASKLQTQNFDLNLFDAQSCIILGTCFPGGSDGK